MFNFTVNMTQSFQMKRMTAWLRSQNWVVLRFLTFCISSVCSFFFFFSRQPFFLNQYSTYLEKWKESTRNFETLMCKIAFNADLSIDFAHLILQCSFNWSLSSEVLDIGALIHISITSKAGFHWQFSSLRPKIFAPKS